MDNLLINFVAVILPSLLFEVFWLDKRMVNTPAKHKALAFVSTLMSQLVCMAFPVHWMSHMSVGVEDVPLILGTLYGGYWVGAGLITVMVTDWSIFSHPHFSSLFLVHAFALCIIFAFVSRFHQMSRRQKSLLMIALSLWSSGILSAVLFSTSHGVQDVARYFLLYGSVNSFTMLVTFSLIEMIQEKQLLTETWVTTKQYQVVGELAASIAHEIRNPLTAVRGFVQLLLSQNVAMEQRAQYLQIMLTEVDRTLQIASEYMGLAKPEAGHEQIVPLNPMVDSIVAVLKPYALLHNVEIQVDHSTPGFVRVDKSRLEQILINIVKNGVEASRDGGIILITVNTHPTKGTVSVAVQDHGVGMDAEQLSKIGNPFYSTKSTGTGLGLTTSYRLVHAMKGSIDITSTKSRGTIVSIRLPMVSNTKPLDDLESDSHAPEPVND